MTELRDRLSAEMIRAMRERDRDGVSTLRTVLAALDNAGAVPQHAGDAPGPAVGVAASEASRRVLEPAEELALVRAEVDELLVAAELQERLGRGQSAAQLRERARRIDRALAG